ncbi:hypothetical protein [Leptospira santarosai]|uniref:hypothetical protein n=1 Tax=Leptospira santarosai TaxID=28183 RepID=UPI0005186283|nr:hypothetical protein [Leptospira santarosai]
MDSLPLPSAHCFVPRFAELLVTPDANVEKFCSILRHFAQDNINPNRDVDILVEMKKSDFDSAAGLQIFLEFLLERHVDLVRKKSKIRFSFLNRIEKDLVNV